MTGNGNGRDAHRIRKPKETQTSRLSLSPGRWKFINMDNHHFRVGKGRGNESSPARWVVRGAGGVSLEDHLIASIKNQNAATGLHV